MYPKVMNGIEKSKEEIQNEVIKLSGLHPSKIRNIYIYGSRVYGTYTVNSDYDIILIACSLYVNHEMHEGIYNIHITTPDAFEDQLKNHDIHCLECIHAPDEAKILTNIDYTKNFRINIGKLKKMIISQSSWAWSKAQRRIERGNIIGGAKSLFHSLRILKFGMQIVEFGKIVDFSMTNNIWSQLSECNDIEWREYQDKWMPVRKGFIREFKRSEMGNIVTLADAFEKK
jgi:predicted nucleotidyltransferase